MAEAEAERAPYAYAVLRFVPSAERGEAVNVGVVLFCRARRFLGAQTLVDDARLRFFAPGFDLDLLARYLDTVEKVAAGDPGGGRLAALPRSERFGSLVAPTSTVVQPGPVHGGACVEPAATLEELFARLVVPPTPERG